MTSTIEPKKEYCEINNGLMKLQKILNERNALRKECIESHKLEEFMWAPSHKRTNEDKLPKKLRRGW